MLFPRLLALDLREALDEARDALEALDARDALDVRDAADLTDSLSESGLAAAGLPPSSSAMEDFLSLSCLTWSFQICLPYGLQ